MIMSARRGAAFAPLLLIACFTARAFAGIEYTRPTLIVTCNLTYNNTGGQLLRYDAETGAFIDRITYIPTPRGVAALDGMLYVASTGGNIWRYNGYNGSFQGFFTVPSWAWPVAAGPDKQLYFASSNGSQVSKMNPNTGAVSVVASGLWQINNSEGIAFGPDGNLYVAGNTYGDIARFNPTTGALLGVIDTTGAAGLSGITFGPDGYIYAAASNSNKVVKIDPLTGTGTPFTTGGSLQTPKGLAFGPDGNLYVTSVFTDNVQRFNGATGEFMNVFTIGGTIDAPMGLTFLVPEPSPVVLCLLPVLRVVMRRRRQIVR